MIHSRTMKLSVAALAATVLLAGCGAQAGGGDDTAAPGAADTDFDPITLTLTDLDLETGINGISMRPWMDEITEKSGGKITFETYYGASLIPAAELVSGLSSGLADIGFVSPALAPDQLPVANWESRVDWATLPDDFPGVFLTGLAASIDRTFGEGAYRDELAGHNLVPLVSNSFTGPLELLCTTPVTTPAEAAGLSVRVGGQPYTDMATALGMTPVSLPHTEVYEALQRGVVDCAMTIPSTFLAAGLLDIGTDLMLPATGSLGGAVQAFNKDSWDALPLAAQQIIWDSLPTAYVEVAKNSLDQYRELIETAEANGIEIHETPEFDTVLKDFRADAAQDLAGNAPAAVTDPEAYMAEYEAVVDEINTFVADELGLSADAFGSAAEAYGAGSESVDWDAYGAYVAELLAPYRPE